MKYTGIILTEPTLELTRKGKLICDLDIRDEDGQDRHVALWDDLANKVYQAVKQEYKVEVFGQEKLIWWTDEQGEKHSNNVINAYRLRVIAKPPKVTYCCLSCAHWQIDCLTGCYVAYGTIADRENCELQENTCITVSSEGTLMHRDCWEGK